MDSPTIAISVSPSPAKGKGGIDKTADDDADAFSISLEVAREEADGGAETTSITIQGVTTGSDETEGDSETTSITIQGVTTGSDEAGTDPSEADITIEIETVVFSGDDLASNMKASTVVGGGTVAVTADGSLGVSGSISGDSEVRLEVGETLTFELPPTEGEVVGGQVTITNLFNHGESGEGALVFAYDTADNQLATYGVLGNDTGKVTVEIDVPFARLDIKAMDNDSWVLAQNSNFGVGSISAMIASVVEDLSEGVGESVSDILQGSKSLLSQLVDYRHSGKVYFEANSVSRNMVSTVDALNNRAWDKDEDQDQKTYDRDQLEAFDHARRAAASHVQRPEDSVSG